MAATQERGSDDPIVTFDVRPQQAGNRPEDAGDVAWGPRARAVRAAVPVPDLGDFDDEDEDEDIAVQVATVFGYAMVGAVLFHVGWWMITGG